MSTTQGLQSTKAVKTGICWLAWNFVITPPPTQHNRGGFGWWSCARVYSSVDKSFRNYVPVPGMNEWLGDWWWVSIKPRDHHKTTTTTVKERSGFRDCCGACEVERDEVGCCPNRLVEHDVMQIDVAPQRTRHDDGWCVIKMGFDDVVSWLEHQFNEREDRSCANFTC